MVVGREIQEGCGVIDDPDLVEQCKSLHGPHSYRTWEDTDLQQLDAACRNDADGELEQHNCRRTLLKGVRHVEAGRWDDALGEMHRFIAALDQDEREQFARRNPNLVDRVNGWAVVQDQMPFNDLPTDTTR